MIPSDWIAIGALIVAVANIVFNYLTNKENIKARRVEIVMEKSIEAYHETVAMIETVANCINNDMNKEAGKVLSKSMECTTP